MQSLRTGATGTAKTLSKHQSTISASKPSLDSGLLYAAGGVISNPAENRATAEQAKKVEPPKNPNGSSNGGSGASEGFGAKADRFFDNNKSTVKGVGLVLAGATLGIEAKSYFDNKDLPIGSRVDLFTIATNTKIDDVKKEIVDVRGAIAENSKSIAVNHAELLNIKETISRIEKKLDENTTSIHENATSIRENATSIRENAKSIHENTRLLHEINNRLIKAEKDKGCVIS
jgi:hypothetical protein